MAAASRPPGEAGSRCERIVPVILCGGSGTRLWPLSRELHPKQLLGLVGEASLLQQTAKRLSDPRHFAPPIVVCSEHHRFAVVEQLAAVGVAPSAVVIEPMGRNTAPAIAAAAHLAEPGSLLLAVPSDAYVADDAGYVASLLQGLPAACAGWLVTFGIEPSRAETGYGYIREGDEELVAGVRRVDRFHEKPDAQSADAYLADRRQLWNAGMFLVRADVYLDELDRHAGEVAAAMRVAVASARSDLGFTFLHAEAFGVVPAISIDHAVMERTDRAAVTRLATGWSDVGSWQELWRASPHDEDDNVVLGDVVMEDCSGSYIHADGRLVAAVGLRDQIVVATKDVVLVVPRERAQEVRTLVSRIAAAGRSEHHAHTRVQRPWGCYETVDRGPGFQVKRITVKPGGRLSLQRHARRAEHWTVVGGTARVTVGDNAWNLGANQSVHIPLGAVHRLENLTEAPVDLIEVQCGDYLGEDDIERLEDVYNRTAEHPVAAE